MKYLTLIILLVSCKDPVIHNNHDKIDQNAMEIIKIDHNKIDQNAMAIIEINLPEIDINDLERISLNYTDRYSIVEKSPRPSYTNFYIQYVIKSSIDRIEDNKFIHINASYIDVILDKNGLPTLGKDATGITKSKVRNTK